MILRNTLTRRREDLNPIEPGRVRMYSCGPTVYRQAHIGNMRSYMMADWIRRTLEYLGFEVTHVKNITDVGHMRQEMLERGEDKVIAAARAAGKTAEEIAQEYTGLFHQDEASLNILPANHFPKATAHIQEMQDLINRLLQNGYAYELQGNVYFEVSKLREYGKLSGNLSETDLIRGARAEVDPLKRDPRDFALWKAAEPGRELKWPSPWGEGFPGWHVECSAMSTKYLGERFDIHTGGVDNVFPHHEGEIAQNEGAFGHGVVNLWVHSEHLLADGVKMAKSTGNSYTVSDLKKRAIDPLAFRYLCLSVRYRNRLNFTFSSLKAAQRALARLKNRVWKWPTERDSRGRDDETADRWRSRFLACLENDLDMPQALATIWDLVRSNLPVASKRRLLLEFDRVLGLDLGKVHQEYRVPDDVLGIIHEREALRANSRYQEADELRDGLRGTGYVVEDAPTRTSIRPKTPWERYEQEWKTISSSKEASSLIEEPDTVEFSIGVVACNYLNDGKRLIDSVFKWSDGYSTEIVVVDNGSSDGTGLWLEDTARSNSARVRLIHTDHVLGEAAAKNIVLKQSRGSIVVLMDTGAEVQGDVFHALRGILSDHRVGAAGPFGLVTDDLRHFREVEGQQQEVDAVQAYCFAFRRSLLRDVGLMRESFRFYRNLDIEYSFHFKDRGYSLIANPALPIVRHEHRVWTSLSEEEREKLSARNFKRFLDKWSNRYDLLTSRC